MRKIIVFILACAAAAVRRGGAHDPGRHAADRDIRRGLLLEHAVGIRKGVRRDHRRVRLHRRQDQEPNYDNYAENGHVEAVQVTWDPSARELRRAAGRLLASHRSHRRRRAVRRPGPQYRPIVYLHERPAEGRRRRPPRRRWRSRESFPAPIATEIRKAGAFYPAEDYHQDYPKKNPDNYAVLLRQLRAGRSSLPRSGEPPR